MFKQEMEKQLLPVIIQLTFTNANTTFYYIHGGHNGKTVKVDGRLWIQMVCSSTDVIYVMKYFRV